MFHFGFSCEFPQAILQKFCFKLLFSKQINVLSIQKASKCFITYTAFGVVSFIPFIKQNI